MCFLISLMCTPVIWPSEFVLKTELLIIDVQNSVFWSEFVVRICISDMMWGIKNTDYLYYH